MTTNSLMPQSQPSPQEMQNVPAPPDPIVQASAMHDQAHAQFSKLLESRSMMDKMRIELETLTKLGDTIMPEDVIKGAGTLVSHGVSPTTLASMMADMPEGGQALQAWVGQHAARTMQGEQQLNQMIGAARAKLGAAGLNLITQHARSPAMAAPPNALGVPANG